MLFLIPIGGGIPGGILLAKTRGIAWPVMMFLYFCSDVVLACVFEPIMLAFIRLTKDIKKMEPLRQAFRLSIQKSIALYGNKTGPLALIVVALGVDPMTGRAAARSAGHGFVTGWLIAITGDMLYFSILMVSTLWLNGILGNGTLTMFIILALMIAVPWGIRKIRESNFQS